jgi:hypothetical protein
MTGRSKKKEMKIIDQEATVLSTMLGVPGNDDECGNRL